MIQRRIAAWLCPDMDQKAKSFEKLLATTSEVHYLFKNEIPEISQACDWIIGRSCESYAHLYKLHSQYPSLARFRDVLINEYQRKMK